MQQRCSIFFFDGYVSIAPTIINLSKLISKRGLSVTIFATHNKDMSQPEIIGTQAKVLYFPKIIKLYLFAKRRLTLRLLARTLEIAGFSYQSVMASLQSSCQTDKFKNNINIGVDLHGSCVALLYSYLFKQKFVFLSLELESAVTKKLIKLFRFVYRPLISIAESAYKKAECVIVQDEDRFKSLCEYYRYQHPKVFYLSNSPLNDFSPDINSINFFRNQFNLSQEDFPYIVLQAGQLSDIVCSKSLAHAFASIDNGCALVFHGVEATGLLKEENPYIQSLRQVNSKNLFLSLSPLPFEEVDKIYASSTIGLAFYANEYAEVDNYGKIGKASGKLAQYLKHGKPVLVSNFPSLSQLVGKYRFGIAINNPSDAMEVKLAISKILNSYDTYSNGARACFEAEFNFEQEMQPILTFIDSLKKKQGL